MNIIKRAQTFVQSKLALARRSRYDWRVCPRCGGTNTHCNGSYQRHPWSLTGQESLRVQRHLCRDCSTSYSETSPLIDRHRRYARQVVRASLDLHLHLGASLRGGAEFVRSLIGQQERYLSWLGLPDQEQLDEEQDCRLCASTLCRWLAQAGERAQAMVAGSLEGASVEAVAVDGLWARLRGKAKRVVLLAADCVSGLVYAPTVVEGEEGSAAWAKLFEQAGAAGLELEQLVGVVSDGAAGLGAYLREQLPWPHHQRCLWHYWRSSLRPALARVTEAAREEVTGLVVRLMQASRYEAAEAALAALAGHAEGKELAALVADQFDQLFVHLLSPFGALTPASPEWLWRDYRLRLGRGRNHASEERLAGAVLVWSIYHNFTPAQRRSEKKRTYRHPGLSPLEVAGLSPGNLSYLDALAA